MMEWSPSNWRPGRLLRSARPFVPSGIRSAYALDAANDTAGNQQQQAHEAANADGDDQAMQQTMCDLVLGEIQTQMDRVHQEAVSNIDRKIVFKNAILFGTSKFVNHISSHFIFFPFFKNM